MWANTQTDRFKAIVAGAGLSNWVSYYGTNGINTWMLPFFGKPLYDDYDAYRRVSAVNYVKNAKTPTRSEEHTSELQSLMRISYAVFCLKKKTSTKNKTNNSNDTLKPTKIICKVTTVTNTDR